MGFRKYLTAVMATGAILAKASAGEWKVEKITQSMDVKGKAAADYTYDVLIVSTTDPKQPEMRFGCSERYGLTAAVTFEPAETSNPVKSRNLKLRNKTTKLSVEGRDPEMALWTVIRETRTVQTRSQKTAAMLYNAAVQERAITIDEPYKSEVTITPPVPDADFTYFAQNCHITNGSG